MFTTWFGLMLLVALVDWYAVCSDRYPIRYVTKPLVLALLIVWFTTAGGWQIGGGLFFGLGLVFSLLGDIFLLKGVLIKRPGFFQLGLAAFLVTQVMYVLGFNQPAPLVSWRALTGLLAVGAVGYVNGRRMVVTLRQSTEGQKQVGPVGLYLVALSLMLASAVSTLFRPGWPPAAALLAALGAGLFYISDSVLAHDAFVEHICTGETLLTVTYHLGQIAIIAAVLLR